MYRNSRGVSTGIYKFVYPGTRMGTFECSLIEADSQVSMFFKQDPPSSAIKRQGNQMPAVAV